MALFSLAGDATLLVFYSKKVLTEKQFLFRTVIHFILLEIVLMTFAGLLQLYESTLEAVAFFLHRPLGVFHGKAIELQKRQQRGGGHQSENTRNQ